LLLGHTKLESTVRYLGIEVDDALTLLNKPNSKSGCGLAGAWHASEVIVSGYVFSPPARIYPFGLVALGPKRKSAA
jgi:hypothetical protein